MWLAEFGDRHRTDVDAVDQHPAFGDVVEAADQVDQRGFAGTGMADQADHFARLDDQIDIAGDGAGAIAKAGLLQFDAAGDAGQMHRVGRFRHARDTWSRMSKMRLVRAARWVAETMRLIESGGCRNGPM